MNKCVICGREHNKAGKYCSGACRAKQSRKAHAHAGKAHEVKRTVEVHVVKTEQEFMEHVRRLNPDKPANYGEDNCGCKRCGWRCTTPLSDINTLPQPAPARHLTRPLLRQLTKRL